MSRQLVLLLSIMLGANALALPVPGDGSKIEILPAGYTDAEVSIPADKEWWVLFCAPGTSPWLRYAPVVVGPVEEHERRVQAEGFQDEEVILLFRGTKELARGPLATYFTGTLPLAPGVKMTFGPWVTGKNWLEASNIQRGGDSKDGNLLHYQVAWAAQVLVPATEIPNVDDFYARLVWVGDLDQDDRPDLLLDLGLAPSERKLCLFLSSYATGTEIVHLVATFVDHSC